LWDEEEDDDEKKDIDNDEMAVYKFQRLPDAGLVNTGIKSKEDGQWRGVVCSFSDKYAR